MEKKEDLCSLQCPSLLSMDDKSEKYVTGLFTVNEGSLSSNVTAITEEGVSFFSSLPEDENTFQPLKRLNDIQMHVRQVDIEIETFSKDLCQKIKEIDRIVLIAKSQNEVLTEDLKVKEAQFESTELDLNNEVAGLKTENQQLKSEIEELKKNMLNNNPNEMKNKLKDFENENANLKMKIRKLQNIEAENSVLRKKISVTDDVMDEILEKNYFLTHECHNLRTSMYDFGVHQDNTMLTIEINTKTTQVYEANQRLRDAIEKTKGTVIAMKEKVRLIKRKEMEPARPYEENTEKTKEINSKMEEFDRLDQVNKELTDELKHLKLLESELRHDLNCPASKNFPDS